MYKFTWILTLSIIMGGGGCTQDVITQSPEMPKPQAIVKEITVNEAVILKPEDLSGGSPGALMMSSLCEDMYVLQIKRKSSVSGNINLRVFTKDADGTGFSAIPHNIAFHTLDTVFNTILLYDGTTEICFKSTDNCAFIQPFDFSQDIEFEVRWYKVSQSTGTTPETILWESPNRYYYSMYPDDAGDCTTLNPDYCCEYKIIANIVGSGSYSGTMNFFSSWDNNSVNLNPPPEDVDFLVSDNCGPIGARWDTTDHENDGGDGEAEFDCDETPYLFEISEPAGTHGVIFDPYGRMCRLRY